MTLGCNFFFEVNDFFGRVATSDLILYNPQLNGNTADASPCKSPPAAFC